MPRCIVALIRNPRYLTKTLTIVAGRHEGDETVAGANWQAFGRVPRDRAAQGNIRADLQHPPACGNRVPLAL
jgi:hypothetical protein